MNSDDRERVLRRFWSKVNKTDGCWLWTGAQAGGGYGSIFYMGRPRPAHVVSYTLFAGEVPAGLDIDHLCRVRNCVNPAHLEPVTRRENLLRGVGRTAINAAKIACPQGHPLSGANLRIGTGSHAGIRICRECDRLRCRSRYRAIRQQNKALGGSA